MSKNQIFWGTSPFVPMFLGNTDSVWLWDEQIAAHKDIHGHITELERSIIEQIMSKANKFQSITSKKYSETFFINGIHLHFGKSAYQNLFEVFRKFALSGLEDLKKWSESGFENKFKKYLEYIASQMVMFKTGSIKRKLSKSFQKSPELDVDVLFDNLVEQIRTSSSVELKLLRYAIQCNQGYSFDPSISFALEKFFVINFVCVRYVLDWNENKRKAMSVNRDSLIGAELNIAGLSAKQFQIDRKSYKISDVVPVGVPRNSLKGIRLMANDDYIGIGLSLDTSQFFYKTTIWDESFLDFSVLNVSIDSGKNKAIIYLHRSIIENRFFIRSILLSFSKHFKKKYGIVIPDSGEVEFEESNIFFPAQKSELKWQPEKKLELKKCPHLPGKFEENFYRSRVEQIFYLKKRLKI